MSARPPYTGQQRKLVIGIDVGTTFSGVSYCILDPGVVPVIQGVNRYPGQERVGGNAKVPSVLYYDKAGSLRAAGAEALLESNAEQAQEQEWYRVEWFKLHLRPTPADLRIDEQIPPLPPNKTIVQVLSDFLRYLYCCTRVYIEETHASGSQIWESLGGQIVFVLTHPNGWEGAQQAQMRNAAIAAGLIPDTFDGRSRIIFATEGEASLHYCLGNNYASDVIKSGNGVIIVDAGGGTIDLTAYHMKAQNEFEEIAPATCHFQGSVYVTRRARIFLENKLSGSRYDCPQDVALITERFDQSTKLGFRDPSQPSFIRFGTARDTDVNYDIKFGQLRLQGSDVAALFEPCIATIRRAIEQQQNAAVVPVTSVLLVGGFAASDWLFSNLQSHVHEMGLRLIRPDGHLGKAVSDGAVSFAFDNPVTIRAAKATFGIKTSRLFNENDPDHRRRSNVVYTNVAGDKCMPNFFHVILAKGSRVSETFEYRQRYRSNASDFTSVFVDVFVYRGDDPDPKWMDEGSDFYSLFCRVIADVGPLAQTLIPKTSTIGAPYFSFDFDVVLLFGLTELKAQICWQQNGEENRIPAEIVYDLVAVKT